MAKKGKVTVVETTKEIEGGGSKTGWPMAIVGGVLSVWAFFGINNYLNKKRSQDASGSIQTDENSRMATMLYTTLRANGATRWWEINYYAGILGVIEIAKQIKDWRAVQARYKDLYGEDITVVLNDVLLPDDYNRFLLNLSAKGLPTNSSGTGTVQPVTNIPKGTRFVFNQKAHDSVVNLYRNTSDYAGKPYVSLPRGRKTNNALVFSQAVRFKYLGSSVTTELYQVTIPGVSIPVWINSYFLTRATT